MFNNKLSGSLINTMTKICSHQCKIPGKPAVEYKMKINAVNPYEIQFLKTDRYLILWQKYDSLVREKSKSGKNLKMCLQFCWGESYD